MAILVSGSLVYDHIMNFPDSFKNHILPDQLHILNVCFMVDKLERSWGGTAGNIAFTMKMLGGEPLVVSVLGKDGRDYLEYLKEAGIKTNYIFSDKKQSTASAYITTDADDNQITGFFGGPLGQAKEKKIADTVKEKFDLAIISPTDKEVMMHHLKECKEM
ncbi:MAG: carbohydrate kinase family protein, partial [Candidatus Magasanikbacteria bacterium]|nr:carbohydrate kinase family protein [Candidatus Magasanikbacteria bacterium]